MELIVQNKDLTSLREALWKETNIYIFTDDSSNQANEQRNWLVPESGLLLWQTSLCCCLEDCGTVWNFRVEKLLIPSNLGDLLFGILEGGILRDIQMTEAEQVKL